MFTLILALMGSVASVAASADSAVMAKAKATSPDGNLAVEAIVDCTRPMRLVFHSNGDGKTWETVPETKQDCQLLGVKWPRPELLLLKWHESPSLGTVVFYDWKDNRDVGKVYALDVIWSASPDLALCSAGMRHFSAAHSYSLYLLHYAPDNIACEPLYPAGWMSPKRQKAIEAHDKWAAEKGDAYFMKMNDPSGGKGNLEEEFISDGKPTWWSPDGMRVAVLTDYGWESGPSLIVIDQVGSPGVRRGWEVDFAGVKHDYENPLTFSWSSSGDSVIVKSIGWEETYTLDAGSLKGPRTIYPMTWSDARAAELGDFGHIVPCEK